jgi:predicted DNA-binding transcriptional regulator YafY
MSEQLKAIFVNASTGEVIERDFTPEEVEAHEKTIAESLARQKAHQAVRTSALAKLAALGLTEEEIAAL